MLNLFKQQDWNCQGGSRRNFLMQVGSLAGLGISLDRAMQVEAASKTSNELNCILIWTRGGTSHIDSIDPKPDAIADVRGEFKTISTAVPGIQFTEYMPQFAKKLGSFSVLRNLNPRNGSHSTADAIMMSGKPFNQTITYPCFGSAISKEKGKRNSLPPFIQLGSNVDRLKRAGLGGYLGIEYNPFEVPGDPNSKTFKVRDVTPPGGLPLSRFEKRRQALNLLDTLPRKDKKNAGALEATDQFYRNAFEVISSPQTKKAFDLSQEKAELRDAYGRHTFGQSCLLARRLVESGARFVTVSDGGWDTHGSNFKTLRSKLPPVDQGMTALIEDLKDRGLLANTLVVWMTDFGRTSVINANSGRDHSSTASYICMSGIGTPGGAVIGQTDAKAERVVGKEYYAHDVAATIYSKLGISLDTFHIAPDGRPIRLCDGHPIPELMG
ncbi:MAG: DUF1501 domain-containing protein [Planctomycetes bacterium]|nr:DUF1501 domain-containing protein [Planctomycetota bacterium]MCH9723642.1 DUF1501 domain-containing protein [Planctomycetota bacterium]MCH9778460.1 DUF1501 domain-containing protein [Planctomycetota bacterium]MCH9791451.1 DUF1501 domain-containing protein [Planctomycetota bacterium]MDF1742286.1 DUF1501 domain-containing protein [Gimesia sp.]